MSAFRGRVTSTPANFERFPCADAAKEVTLTLEFESIVVALPKKRAYAHCRPVSRRGLRVASTAISLRYFC